MARMGGDAVGSGGNFARSLTLNDGKVVPRGELDLDEGEKITKLEVWMVQHIGEDVGAALTCSLNQDALRGSTTHWDGVGVQYDGVFVQGIATGTALAIVKTAGGSVTTRSWTETVKIEPPPA